MLNYDDNAGHWFKTYFLSPAIQQKLQTGSMYDRRSCQTRTSFQRTINYAFTVLPVETEIFVA